MKRRVREKTRGHQNRIGDAILKLRILNNRKANEKRIKLNLDKNLRKERKYMINKMGRKIYY